jgi:N-acyl-D-aspartate/D-glutamate deacylase
MDAIRKLSLMPAQRLEKLAPVFRSKGRLKVGADADITVFDPSTVTDKSTYQAACAPIGGVPVRTRECRAGGRRWRLDAG